MPQSNRSWRLQGHTILIVFIAFSNELTETEVYFMRNKISVIGTVINVCVHFNRQSRDFKLNHFALFGAMKDADIAQKIQILKTFSSYIW